MINIFKDVLKSLRKAAHLSQSQLAEKLGLAPSTVGNYEQGTRIPDYETLELIADFFNVNMDLLFDRSEIRKELKYPVISDSIVSFPVIGELAAGYEHIAMEDWSGETIEIPESYLKGRKREDYLVLSVKGDSMYPHYQNGDKVLILKQDCINESGDIAAVIYDGEYATLKKVEYKKDAVRLLPLNPEYMPKEISGADLEQFKIIGIPRLLVREIND